VNCSEVSNVAVKKTQPKYLFDLYGVLSVLSSGNNQARDAFINGMSTGSVRIMSEVAGQLKAVNENLYHEFQAIKSGRVYQVTTAAHWATQQILMDKHGTGLFGGSPSPEYFESVAICKVEKLALVTAEKSLTSCRDIAKKCNLTQVAVLSLTDFAAQA
jgi:hypothetical protein